MLCKKLWRHLFWSADVCFLSNARFDEFSALAHLFVSSIFCICTCLTRTKWNIQWNFCRKLTRKTGSTTKPWYTSLRTSRLDMKLQPKRAKPAVMWVDPECRNVDCLLRLLIIGETFIKTTVPDPACAPVPSPRGLLWTEPLQTKLQAPQNGLGSARGRWIFYQSVFCSVL